MCPHMNGKATGRTSVSLQGAFKAGLVREKTGSGLGLSKWVRVVRKKVCQSL